MALTAAQNAVLKAAMLADSTVVALGTQDQKIADYYNSNSAMAIWRPNVRNSEITASVSASSYILLTAQQQKALDLYIGPDICDATSANVRTGFAQIFGAGQTLTNLTAVAQRLATNFEVLFATGGPPAITTVFGYILTDIDVNHARAS